MSHRSSVELLEYTRLTLQLIVRHPHRGEDTHLASELKSVLEQYIAELELETSSPARTMPGFRILSQRGHM